jgi:hypothetical protein
MKRWYRGKGKAKKARSTGGLKISLQLLNLQSFCVELPARCNTEKRKALIEILESCGGVRNEREKLYSFNLENREHLLEALWSSEQFDPEDIPQVSDSS